VTTADAPTPGKAVGQRIKRTEDPQLIQGLGTFIDDIKLPGMLHLAFRRSDIAHGRIISIDTSAAEAMPGVESVLTGADLKDAVPPQPILTPFPHPDLWAVAPEMVNYVGEPVAVVVASDRYLARDAADAIEVEFEELPAVVDPEAAMEGKPTTIHPEFENNLAVPLIPSGTGVDPTTFEFDNAAIDAALASADIVISQRMISQRLAPTAMEGRGVVAQFDAGKQDLTVWLTTQTPHMARTWIAENTGLGEHQVRVIAPEVGGGFGAKAAPYGEGYVAAHLAQRLGRPVKWVEDRSEAFMATTHGRDLIGYIDLAAQNDGTITGLRVKIIADIGAYETLFGALVPTFTQAMLSGVYDIPVIRADLTDVFTNKMSTDAYRGAGRPEGIYFVERAVDMLAQRLQLDPAELRRKNFIQPDQFPFVTQAGSVYDSGDYEMLLDKTLELADWEGLQAERDAARAEGRIVGLGMAYYVEVCGIGPTSLFPPGGWEHGQVTVTRSGAISATTGASAHGQGHETTFAQLLSDEFGVPMEQISILHGDTAVSKQGTGTFGSRSLAIGGTVLKMAAGKVKEKMARFAAHMMEVQADDLVFANGQIAVADSDEPGLPFAEVAAYAYAPPVLPRDTQPGLSEEAFWEPEGTTYPFGCYIVRVEIDPDTGEVTIDKLVGVDDCGTIINPLIVDGQIHGGLAQGIGQALLENVVYDEDGQLVTGSFMDYAIPRADDLPRFELGSTVTPTPHNPLGAKGVGEAGTIGATPAVANAVVDALSPFGVTHLDIPYTAEKVWHAMQGGAQ
jgi:carbon-monoxide dehydrogenase large subunit